MAPFRLADVFDDDYLYFARAVLTPERSDAEAALVAKLTGIGPGVRVLDAGCGSGRIANRLAVLGAEVLGVDAVDRLLEEAEKDAARSWVEVRYARADLRELVLAAPVDVAVCWFATFGYHEDHELRRILDRLRAALRPGGRLLLDVYSRVATARAVPAGGTGATTVTRRDGDLLVDTVQLDDEGDRAVTTRVTVRGGVVRQTAYSVRLFSAAELRGSLAAAGFRRVELYGPDGLPFTAASRRILAVATAD